MPNTNCLAGIKCPKCGSEDRFKIETTTIFEVTDDGTDVHEDVGWDDDSYIECMACAHHGTIKDFRVEEDDSDKTVVNPTHPDPFLGEVLNAANAMLNATGHRGHKLGIKEETLLSPAERVEIRARRRLIDAVRVLGMDYPRTVTNVFIWWDIDGHGERAIIPANSINDAIQLLWKDGHSVGEPFKEFEARMLEADHTEYGVEGVIFDDPFSDRKETHERGGRKDGDGGRPDGGAEEGLR